ncbi:hypothetical protein ACHAWU_010207 [Discostella pseudostelligera]|uniref:Exostosin GT47 domain-containing protein n=1 Tax=Discostella pseudostelligera TaxID=259834 RepID=A0ABD3MF89_9STRA
MNSVAARTKRRTQSPAFAIILLFLVYELFQFSYQHGQWVVFSPSQPNSSWQSKDESTTITNLFVVQNFEVVTTNYGWSSTSTHDAGKNSSRRIVTGEFYRSIISHLRYNASAWADLEKHPDPSRRLIVFMDVDTCLEMNYPFYGTKDWLVNMEDGYPDRYWNSIFEDNCPLIARASNSPALLANPDSRLIILDCSGGSHLHLTKACAGDNSTFQNDQVTVAYISIDKRRVRPFLHTGLPPPAIKYANLSEVERSSVKMCKYRKYLFSFQGRDVGGRKDLFRNIEQFNGTYVKLLNQKSYLGDLHKGGDDSNNYIKILTQSVFAGAPRGDQLFSYRLSEILSAGAIPVMYNSEYLLPFHGVINWTDCAVLIEPGQDTLDIITAISPDRVCEMQNCALGAWDKYVSSRTGWVRGLIDVALSLPPNNYNAS